MIDDDGAADDGIDVRVHFNPQSDAVVFDDHGTPMLLYERHPQFGYGWTLWYLESWYDPEANGVDDYFIGGCLTEVDSAVRDARRWLRLRRAPSDTA